MRAAGNTVRDVGQTLTRLVSQLSKPAEQPKTVSRADERLNDRLCDAFEDLRTTPRPPPRGEDVFLETAGPIGMPQQRDGGETASGGPTYR